MVFRRKSFPLLVAGLLVCVGFSFTQFYQSSRPFNDLPEGIQRADVEDALALTEATHAAESRHRDALVWIQLARWSFLKDDFAAAATCYSRIPNDLPVSATARTLEGETRFRLHQAAACEETLRKAIELAGDDTEKLSREWYGSRDWLRQLVEMELRYEERHSLLAEIHTRFGKPTLYDSVAYFYPSLLRWNGEDSYAKLMLFLKNEPHNSQLKLAQLRYHTGQGRLAEAEKLIAEDQWPNLDLKRLAAAQMEYLEACGDWSRIGDIIAALPSIQPHDSWLLLEQRGRFAIHSKKWDEAETAFSYLRRADETNLAAHNGLSHAYSSMNRPEEAEAVRSRSEILSRIRNRLGDVLGTSSPDALVAVAELSLELQQRNAARWMIFHALQKSPRHANAQLLLKRLGDE